MSNKRAKIFLCIGLICFLLTTVGVIITTKLEYNRDKEIFANDPYELKFENALTEFMLYFVEIPFLAVELSGIRSTYKLLKYKPKGDVKICYLISASLAFLAISVVLLCYVGALIISISNFYVSIMIITLWPSFITSFAIGSIPIKHKKKDNVSV